MDTRALDKLLRSLKGNMPIARVGVLGSKTVRTETDDEAPTNAEIGVKHEFGMDGLPIRSLSHR
jgi:hypothetical protein